jgi:SNF2 family DNA or RNA helicase
LFLGSITATGTGINKLQKRCSSMAVGEFIYNPMKILQTEGRLHRMGQKKRVTAYYFAAQDTVESKICKILFSKTGTINQVVDGSSANQFDIFSEVFKQKRNT